MSLLGLSGGGGAYIRFSPSVNSWVLGKDEIQLKKVLFDLDSVKTGWGKMAEGQAPEWIWDDGIGRRAARPSDEHKRGFSVRVFLGPAKGWAEWSSTGTGPCMGFEALFDAAAKDRAANAGKVLAAVYTGSKAEKIGKGNTRVPAFEIAGWVDRPADDSGDDEPPMRATPPATGSKAVPPPSKAATADLEDFG